ncbi:MAG: helix-turn-helix domain-containing protein [Acidobacteriota bacterium]
MASPTPKPQFRAIQGGRTQAPIERTPAPPAPPRDASVVPKLLRAEEVAEILRTSRKAIYAMAERGLLPGVTRIGRKLLIRQDELARWLEARRVPTWSRTR